MLTFSGNGTATTTFNKTPVTMPTYLLAFVISDLTPNTLFPGRQKIYTVSSLNNYVTTSLLYSIQFLSQLENFVNVTYKFPKLDSVAVPDHGSAMENYVSYNGSFENDITINIFVRV